ncbi:hypothetical protein [Candidatus Hodarchaeum mangrovi]
MQPTRALMGNRNTSWVSNNKGVVISSFFGLLFVIIRIWILIFEASISSAIVVLMETVQLVILFLGLMIFVYNFGYVVIMLTVDEGLNEEEKNLLKWMIKRAIMISVFWFVSVLSFLIIFQRDPFLLASANCFLLASLFFFIRKGENPLVEGTFV